MRMNSKMAQHLSQLYLNNIDQLHKEENVQPLGVSLGMLEHGYAQNEKNIIKKKAERN
ncbi:hypothetical protein [Alkalicoccobacillus porphyridii]|uniref:hypothetical protein n=1 Tax=Alkalicoccobacillus porphyridii TaxID=2597270 RepID=UPI00163DE5BC|nr:hypothetical protein [Alkalicoccobacillus porphyridii]